MNELLRKIFETRVVTDAQGRKHELHSETSEQQCALLQKAVFELKPEYSLEVGLAFGVSALCICEALQAVGTKRHIVVDPFQTEQWHGIGLKNLQEAGYGELIDFREQYSHQALPALLAEGVKLDFAYVDTTKLFDVVLVDLYFVHLLLNIGGVCFVDDCGSPGIRKVCRFLARHPGWKIYSKIGEQWISPKRVWLSRLVRQLPRAQQVFANNLLDTDADLSVNAHCVAFEKVSEDNRHWSWFEEF